MKIKNEKELFDLFVDNKNICYREWMTKPFIDSTYNKVIATNGYVLIMVNPECVSGNYETLDKCKQLHLMDYNSDYTISVSAIKDAIEECPKVEEFTESYEEGVCPECDGIGEVEAEYRATTDGNYYFAAIECPICEGTGKADVCVKAPTGKMITDEDSTIKICDGYFKPSRISYLVKACKLLSVNEIRMVKHDRIHENIFALNDDVHIVIMPKMMEEEMADAEVELGK